MPKKESFEMVDSIQGGPASPGGPNRQEEYKKEFAESIHLFSESLAQYRSSTQFQKKVMLKNAMSKSLEAMGDSANAMLNKELQAQKEKLQHDYDDYTAHESDEGYQKLQDDIHSMEADQ